MNDYKSFAAVTLLGLALTISAFPTYATPIPGIDAPLAGSNVQKGYGSGSKSNFGQLKIRKKAAATAVEK